MWIPQKVPRGPAVGEEESAGARRRMTESRRRMGNTRQNVRKIRKDPGGRGRELIAPSC